MLVEGNKLCLLHLHQVHSAFRLLYGSLGDEGLLRGLFPGPLQTRLRVGSMYVELEQVVV